MDREGSLVICARFLLCWGSFLKPGWMQARCNPQILHRTDTVSVLRACVHNVGAAVGFAPPDRTGLRRTAAGHRITQQVAPPSLEKHPRENCSLARPFAGFTVESLPIDSALCCSLVVLSLR